VLILFYITYKADGEAVVAAGTVGRRDAAFAELQVVCVALFAGSTGPEEASVFTIGIDIVAGPGDRKGNGAGCRR